MRKGGGRGAGRRRGSGGMGPINNELSVIIKAPND